MSLGCLGPRADVQKCQIHPLLVCTSTLDALPLLVVQHLMATQAGLSPLQNEQPT